MRVLFRFDAGSRDVLFVLIVLYYITEKYQLFLLNHRSAQNSESGMAKFNLTTHPCHDHSRKKL